MLTKIRCHGLCAWRPAATTHRHLVVLALLVGTLVLLTSIIFWLRRPPETRVPVPSTRVRSVDAAAGDATYVGPHVCSECHADRVTDFLKTNHHRTSRLPDDSDMLGDFAPGRNIYRTRNPDLWFQMTAREHEFFQTAVWNTADGEQRRTERIDIVFGAGAVAEMYLYWRGDRLLQLPMNYLRPLDGWANSAGYRDGTANFDRQILPRCLECHATYFEHVPATRNRYNRDHFIVGVSCERCHGPGSEHVAYHRAFPDDDNGKNIVDPRELSHKQLLDLCAQCHSEAGERRTDPFSYRPGEPLEQSFVQLSWDKPREDDHTGNQVRYLQQSRCFENSSELTCITCHDPHQPEGPKNAASARRSCLPCHQAAHCGAQERLPAAMRGRCIDCHMPQKHVMSIRFHTPTDDYVPLVTRREHRIGVYPDTMQELLIEWHRAQAGADHLAHAQELTGQLDGKRRAEAAALRADHRLIASIGAYRDLLRLRPDDAEASRGLKSVLDTQMKLVKLMELARRQLDEGSPTEALGTYADVLRINPKHADAHHRLGDLLLSLDRLEKAIRHYRQAVQLRPDYAEAHNNLGLAVQSLGRLEESERHYRQALEVRPRFVEAHHNLGNVLQLQGKLDEAIDHYGQAMRLRPDTAELHHSLGAALQSMDRLDEAAGHFRRAVAANPDYTDAHYGLAEVLMATGQWADAITHLGQTLRLRPGAAVAHRSLGVVLARTDRIEPGIEHLREAARLEPDWPEPRADLAWILATNPDARDGETAVRHAELAAQLIEPPNPMILDVLAAAYAAAGRFDRAVATAGQALDLATAAGDPQIAQAIRHRLDLYRQAMPYDAPALPDAARP